MSRSVALSFFDTSDCDGIGKQFALAILCANEYRDISAIQYMNTEVLSDKLAPIEPESGNAEMKARTMTLWVTLFALSASLMLTRKSLTQEPPPATPQPGVDVLAKGPVHEAFARPDTEQVQPKPVIPKQPPDPVEEQPPDQKPDGDNVRWIPGYWAWDDEQNEYIWVSGFWRDVPPGRTWVPGHWQQIDGGWQWSAGFWAANDQQEVTYLPTPPESIETGPSTPEPNANAIYTPGCWVWQETRFLWRPGFWVPYRAGWVWSPAHYIWTPGGCVFVEGYWDYPLEQRGLLFAPCRIGPAFFTRPRAFIPSYVIQPDFLIGAMFVRPSWRWYYFGDYFEPRYATRGFIPWIDFHIGRNVLDPNYAYYVHRFGNDETWVKNLHELYVGRREGRIERPPHTWTEQVHMLDKARSDRRLEANIAAGLRLTHAQNLSALAPISEYHNHQVSNLGTLARPTNQAIEHERHTVKLAPVTKEQRAGELKTHFDQAQKLREQRRIEESRIIGARPKAPVTIEKPRSYKIELPKVTHAPPAVSHIPNRPPLPPPPVLPRHEERPLPKKR
jgi:hypothetical protein